MIKVSDIIKLVKSGKIILTSLDGLSTHELGNITDTNYGKVDANGNKIPVGVMSQNVYNIYVRGDSCVVEFGKAKRSSNTHGSEYCADLFEEILL